MATDRLKHLRQELKAAGDPKRAAFLKGYFKTGPGQYAEGDVMLGVSLPAQRSLAKKYRDLDLRSTSSLLDSPFHEERLTALLILVLQFERADEAERNRIFDFYLSKTDRINNWDLVDTSARDIVGEYLAQKDRSVLFELANSESIWEKRIALIATQAFIKRGHFDDTLRLAEILMKDKEDLIHKASGWMLREVGKRSRPVLEAFLEKQASQMPRTTLRYAIEHFSPEERRVFLQAGRSSLVAISSQSESETH